MISVCMATYNGERYIREQIESIISNLSVSDEIIISDDGSRDNTVSIINEYKKQFSNIYIFEGPKEGVVRNFENAINHSKGDLIFLSDQDDIWVENKVKTVRKVFEDKRIKLVLHDALIIDAEGRTDGETFFCFRNSKAGLLKNLWKNSYIGCCMAFRENLKNEFLPFPENIEMHDWWIGLIAELSRSSVLINDQLIHYRRHDNNVSAMHHHPLPIMIKNRFVIGNALLHKKVERLLSKK